jgi:hypothetical protein
MIISSMTIGSFTIGSFTISLIAFFQLLSWVLLGRVWSSSWPIAPSAYELTATSLRSIGLEYRAWFFWAKVWSSSWPIAPLAHELTATSLRSIALEYRVLISDLAAHFASSPLGGWHA